MRCSPSEKSHWMFGVSALTWSLSLLTRSTGPRGLRRSTRGGGGAFILSCGGGSEEHTSELQSQSNLVCRPLVGKKNTEAPIFAWQPPLAGGGGRWEEMERV